MSKYILVILSIFLANSPCLSAKDLSSIEYESRHLRDGVYMLSGAGGNIAALTGREGVLLVDSDYRGMSEKLKREVEGLSKGVNAVEFVVNTHWHHDHTEGNTAHEDGAVIVAHENVRKRLAAGQRIHFLDREVAPLEHNGLPVITFSEDITLHFNGEELSVEHYRSSHTDGDAVIRFKKANIYHLGDLFFNRRFPFIDHSSGGSLTGLIVSIEALLQVIDDEAMIIPGHGPLSNKKGLEEYLRMLKQTRTIVITRMQMNPDLPSILQDRLPEQFSKWGEGFISEKRWIELIYNEYTGTKLPNEVTD